ncbi:glutamate--tRNA ligase [Sphingomonas astaxanthinifaciens]|uniref:Glutamate--tRNA ligase n=1 Tax=Sphingomonas astaxanthinifaciens DSM 22298 TaxID=1123267 RepID=A0ABQ5Z897_9SPHN|nr:glutamate--tRNA ligase [Sphingomonas astaxanthinifaciens]GLR46792.1 glutamate--tRNA ligase [Sphingomonas astaxanthinifaciens DSM 22298]
MTVVTRFAPSPTGRLHVGNIRTALHNFLFARQHGGRFLLRVDDTDRERSTAEAEAQIHADLAWLGLEPDAAVRQSDRFALYEREFERLRAAGRVYACYETPEELDLRRKILLGRGLPPIYERPEGENAPVEGRAPHWRFRLDHDEPIAWTDLIRGEQKFDPRLLSDPVIRRADGSWLYLLPSVIDDIDLGITHIVRGEDHVSNSAVQLQMFAALGAGTPALAHEALLVAAEGKLSKRLGAVGVGAMQEEGLEPMALLSLLARLGTSQPVEPVASLDTLAATFDFAHFGRAPAHFDMAEVAQLNARLLHAMSFAEARTHLPAWVDEPRWLALRTALSRMAEIEAWRTVVEDGLGAPLAADEDRDFLAAAAAAAAEIDWHGEPWKALTTTLKERSGRKGKALFHPLRLALTARDSGPEMAPLVALLGKERVIARLAAAAGA